MENSKLNLIDLARRQLVGDKLDMERIISTLERVVVNDAGALEARDGEWGFHLTEQELAEYLVEYIEESRVQLTRLETLLAEASPYITLTLAKNAIAAARELENRKRMLEQDEVNPRG